MNQIATAPASVEPAVLAARLADERAPDIVEALTSKRRKSPPRSS